LVDFGCAGKGCGHKKPSLKKALQFKKLVAANAGIPMPNNVLLLPAVRQSFKCVAAQAYSGQGRHRYAAQKKIGAEGENNG
jgi:hypothetical protein